MKKKKNPIVYLWALLPVVSAFLFFLMLMIDVEVGFVVRPVFEFSLVGILCVIFGVFLTGYAGYSLSKNGFGFLKALLIGNILPIICVVVFTVFVIAGSGESDAAIVIGEFGNGIFSVIPTYITKLTMKPLSYFEVYISFAVLLVVFTVGYSVADIKIKK